jgi:hypothetical protein
MSYDNEAIINEKAVPYRRIYAPQVTNHKPRSFNESMDQKIINAKKWIERNYSFIPGERHNFIKQFAGILHRFGVDETTTHRVLIPYGSEGFPDSEIEKIIKGMYSKQFA